MNLLNYKCRICKHAHNPSPSYSISLCNTCSFDNKWELTNEKPKRWSQVFNSSLRYWKSKDDIAKQADESGYIYFSYLGKIYMVGYPLDYGEMGVNAFAGEIVCEVKDLN